MFNNKEFKVTRESKIAKEFGFNNLVIKEKLDTFEIMGDNTINDTE